MSTTNQVRDDLAVRHGASTNPPRPLYPFKVGLGPCCGWTKDEGHAPDCELYAALKDGEDVN